MESSTGIGYQFGPFEVNAGSGELLKQGKRVKLQEQPFRLLIVLLERAGEVVTRAELQNLIWPENTFVDFDSSLRVAVRKLRYALGDDAESPRYIETIPKRGYRFLGPASRQEGFRDRNVAVQAALATVEANATVANRSEDAAPSLPGRRVTLISSVLFLLLAVGVGAFEFASHHKKLLTEKDTVVLADFSNSTGDTVFDETLRQGMAVQLQQSPS